MSKIVKGIKRIVKKVFKGVKKVFKKITSSKLGKILLIGAAIYTGGVLFGAWGSTGPMSGIYGAWSGGAAAAGAETAGAITSAAPALAPEIATTAAAAQTAAPAAIAAAPTVTGAGGVLSATPFGVPAMGTVAPSALPTLAATAPAAAAPGFLSSIGTYAAQNPLLTSMALQGVAGALSPDEMDMAREQERIRRERWANLQDVGDIGLGIQSAEDRTLRSLSGVPWHQRLRR